MVSGTMELSSMVVTSGLIETQRGHDVWGANYVYSKEGLQNDIYLIADAFYDMVATGLIPRSSGTISTGATVGSLTKPLRASGIYMTGVNGSNYVLTVHTNGSVSGYIATV